MEQLVPDLKLHALSFLDYSSVACFTNTRTQTDFSLEQGKVKPANGWKAYYAATLAIVNINAEFFRIVKERSHTAMSQVWLNAGYWRVIYWLQSSHGELACDI